MPISHNQCSARSNAPIPHALSNAQLKSMFRPYVCMYNYKYYYCCNSLHKSVFIQYYVHNIFMFACLLYKRLYVL